MPFDEEDDVSGSGAPSATMTPPVSGATGAGADPSPAPANTPANANAGQMASIGATPPGQQPADNSKQPQQPQAQKPWYSRVYSGVLDALGGSNQVMLERDPQTGKMVATATKSGPGQQWKRIIAGAISGAGSAMAHAGTGPGAAMRGAGLGVEAGMKLGTDQAQQARKDADDDFDQQQTAALNKARTAELSQQGAKAAWELGWEKQKALQGQLDLENQWNDRIAQAGEGSGDLGVFPTFKDYIAATKEDPSLHDAQAHGQLYAITHVNADGVQDGIHVYRVTQGWKDQKTTEPTAFPVVKPGEKIGDPPRLETQTIPAGAMTNGQAMDYIQAQNNKAADMQLKVLNQQSLTKQREAKADKDERPAAPRGGGAASAEDPHVATLGEAIASGRLTTDQIPGFGKMKPQIEAYLAEHHPNLNISSVMLTGDERKRADLANNALHNLEDIGQRIARRPDLLGVIQGRITQGKNLAGTNDPDLAAIDTALDNYALAATGAHGVRAVEARKDAKQAILNGFKNGQQGVQAAVQSARGSLQNLAGAGKPRSVDGTPYVYKTQPQGGGNPQPQQQPAQQGGGFNWDAHPVAN
jgi:hypothetical protein